MEREKGVREGRLIQADEPQGEMSTHTCTAMHVHTRVEGPTCFATPSTSPLCTPWPMPREKTVVWAAAALAWELPDLPCTRSKMPLSSWEETPPSVRKMIWGGGEPGRGENEAWQEQGKDSRHAHRSHHTRHARALGPAPYLASDGHSVIVSTLLLEEPSHFGAGLQRHLLVDVL